MDQEGWWMALHESSAPAERRSRRTKSVAPSERPAPAYPPLPPALDRLFGLVTEPVLKLETAPDDHLTLREIGLLLGDILNWLEEDQIILHAADRLYEAAFALQDARQRRSTCANITERTIHARADAVPVALAAFRESLRAATPNARARARCLTW